MWNKNNLGRTINKNMGKIETLNKTGSYQFNCNDNSVHTVQTGRILKRRFEERKVHYEQCI